MTFRDDHSFIYAPPAPALFSEALPAHDKEWGEPPSSDEVFSAADLEEFVDTDLSYLRFLRSSKHDPEIRTPSQYDPYAEVHLSGMESVTRTPLALFDGVPRKIEGEVSLGLGAIPGFPSELPSMNSDADIYGETHTKPAQGPRLERNHSPSSSFDADLYGSAPCNLSPPRGSDHSNSSQSDDHSDRQLIRKFNTSTLLNVIPEARLHSITFVWWFKADHPTASFLPCALSGSLCRSPIAHPALQQKCSRSCLPKYRREC